MCQVIDVLKKKKLKVVFCLLGFVFLLVIWHQMYQRNVQNKLFVNILIIHEII